MQTRISIFRLRIFPWIQFETLKRLSNWDFHILPNARCNCSRFSNIYRKSFHWIIGIDIFSWWQTSIFADEISNRRTWKINSNFKTIIIIYILCIINKSYRIIIIIIIAGWFAWALNIVKNINGNQW